MAFIKQKRPAAILLIASTNVFASDYTGFMSIIYLMLVVGISMAIHLSLFIYFYFLGKYESIQFAKNHAIIATLLPLSGIFIAIIDYRTQYELLTMLVINLIAIAASFTPLLIRNSKIFEKFYTGKNMFIASIIFSLTGAIIFFPMQFLAIAFGHLSIRCNEGYVRQLSFILLIIFYVHVIYWISFMTKVMLFS